jgi:hypothetical protein
MRPLVAVRRAAPFDPTALLRSPLMWPLARATAALGPLSDFPPASLLGRVFEGAAPVRFVPATPRARRRRGGGGGPPVIEPDALYDGRITLAREVPTRPGCWHDFMNALVWGTFPLAKRALHARQHRAVSARIAPGATTLPAARTRELDALAILDEGGVAVLARDPGPLRDALKAAQGAPLRSELAAGNAVAVIFGHAIYESLALGVRPAVVAALVLGRKDDQERDAVGEVDRALSSALDDTARLCTPDELARIEVSDLLAL